jgi:predicted Zn-dependent protease
MRTATTWRVASPQEDGRRLPLRNLDTRSSASAVPEGRAVVMHTRIGMMQHAWHAVEAQGVYRQTDSMAAANRQHVHLADTLSD